MPPTYHFTDLANLGSILAAGELRCHSTADCSVDVADATIKPRLMSKRVPCGPGGTVGDYVPFYFAPRSPMLFRIQRGGVENVSSDPARLVYLVSSTEAVVEGGHDYVFTDGNAAAAFTAFHDDDNAVEAALETRVQRLDAARLDAHAWRLWERLIAERGIVIDRRRGEGHPLYPDMIYPYDYGHVPGTAAPDGHEVDAFVGRAHVGLVGLIALVHEPSGIADPKLLVNLTLDDADVLMAFLDRGDPGPNLTLVWRQPECQRTSTVRRSAVP